jgi:hypothetical protein
MRTNGRTFGQIILFLIVVLLSILMFSNGSYVPYSRPSTYARYEAFAGVDPSGGVVDPSGGAVKESLSEVDPSGNSNSSPSSILQSLFGAKKEVGAKKEGFGRLLPALQPSSELSGAVILDRFSQLSDKSTGSSGECVSAGLSNSKGPLCLTPELIDLLKTRGNNM